MLTSKFSHIKSLGTDMVGNMEDLPRSWELVWKVIWLFITCVPILTQEYGFMHKALQSLEKFKMKSHNSIMLLFLWFLLLLALCQFQDWKCKIFSQSETPHIISKFPLGILKLQAHPISLYFSFCVFKSSPDPLWGHLTMRIIYLNDPANVWNSLMSFSLCFHLLLSTLPV